MVLPYINMNPPQVYTCSPSWSPLPSSLPIPSLWVVSVHQPQASSIMHWTWTGDSFHIWYYTCFNAIQLIFISLAFFDDPGDVGNLISGSSAFSFFFFLFLNKFIYFNWRLITLQYCTGFAIHQHVPTTVIHVFPILNFPPSSLPIPSLWVVSVHQPQASSIMHQTGLFSSFLRLWIFEL